MKRIILSAVFSLFLGSSSIVFAQSKTTSPDEKHSSATELKQQQADSVFYTCPMHHDIKMKEAGQCSKCGMNLKKETVKISGKKNKMKEAKKKYTCSMCAGTYTKPGKCSHCKMDLIEKVK